MTQIFESYFAFSQREDKLINGVSKIFAEEKPDWVKDNEDNEGCWNCSGCSRCSDCYGCSDCSDCSGCSRCSGCSDCSGCSRCSGCSDCSDCSGCSRCSDCYGCSDCSRLKNASPVQSTEENTIAGFKVPVIENIHSKVFEAANNPSALDMSAWHTCDTTHCRAGWAVFLAGPAGRELEKKTSTLFAAMQIYKTSSEIKVSPPRFFEGNETALADMKRCAEEETAIK